MGTCGRSLGPPKGRGGDLWSYYWPPVVCGKCSRRPLGGKKGRVGVLLSCLLSALSAAPPRDSGPLHGQCLHKQLALSISALFVSLLAFREVASRKSPVASRAELCVLAVRAADSLRGRSRALRLFVCSLVRAAAQSSRALQQSSCGLQTVRWPWARPFELSCSAQRQVRASRVKCTGDSLISS